MVWRHSPIFGASINAAGLGECDGKVTHVVVVHELLATLVAHIPGVIHDVADFVLALERIGASAPHESFAVGAVRGGESKLASIWDFNVLYCLH